MNPLQKYHKYYLQAAALASKVFFQQAISNSPLLLFLFVILEKKPRARWEGGRRTTGEGAGTASHWTKAATSWARAGGSLSTFLSQGSNQEVFYPIQEEEMQSIFSFVRRDDWIYV